MILRVLLAIAAFASALFASVWLTAILALVLAIGWEAWEVIFLGVLVDMLYLPPEGLWHIPMPATLLAIAIVWLMIPIRNRLAVGR
ncbi:MAG TPA: hypothetical protein VFL98_00975 [Candidatus Paceibacterota bacterium]|nr:hypothetical protein [Candidatus Paceibacterota bacterium]